MGLSEKIMIGTLFPLLFCGIGDFLLKKASFILKQKKIRKSDVYHIFMERLSVSVL